jgi:succinyl-diaminopimelate desuccinylase
MIQELVEKVDSYREEMIKTLAELIKIKSLSPENGGEGEFDKAEYLTKLLKEFHVERYDAKDERVKGSIRPNLVVRLKGEKKKALWIISHLDVVPEGDTSLWQTNPFEPVIKEGKIYGRGSEDNGQAIVSSLFAIKAIAELGLTPKYTLCLAFVSDEEVGSRHGIQHLLKQNIFRKDDLFVVPDAGTSDGSMIEIAEKSILWLKFVVHGRQAHASKPEGINAARRAMKFILELDEKLHARFNKVNLLFNPPYSTFEPTKREKNVDNINTIPGLDVSYMDCRILPDYSIDEVLEFVESLRMVYERDGLIEVEVVQKEHSPSTPENSEIVELLKKAISSVRGITPSVFGIGGNTCAAFFRKAGFHTAVWSTVDGTAHKPNEYAVIDNIVEDAKVFAVLPFV